MITFVIKFVGRLLNQFPIRSKFVGFSPVFNRLENRTGNSFLDTSRTGGEWFNCVHGLSANDRHLTVLFYVQSLTFQLLIHSVKTTDRLKTCSVRQVQEKNTVLHDFHELTSILDRDFALNHPILATALGKTTKTQLVCVSTSVWHVHLVVLCTRELWLGHGLTLILFGVSRWVTANPSKLLRVDANYFQLNKGVKLVLERRRTNRQQRPESPTVTLTWHASK